jgi:hypothetical protein
VSSFLYFTTRDLMMLPSNLIFFSTFALLNFYNFFCISFVKLEFLLFLLSFVLIFVNEGTFSSIFFNTSLLTRFLVLYSTSSDLIILSIILSIIGCFCFYNFFCVSFIALEFLLLFSATLTVLLFTFNNDF